MSNIYQTTIKPFLTALEMLVKSVYSVLISFNLIVSYCGCKQMAIPTDIQTYLVFLLLELFLQIKFLSFQIMDTLPEFLGFFPDIKTCSINYGDSRCLHAQSNLLYLECSKPRKAGLKYESELQLSIRVSVCHCDHKCVGRM